MKLINSYRSLRPRGGPLQNGRRISQLVGLAALTIVFAATDRADAAAVSNGAVEAKLAYCQDCHGPMGQGYRGFFPIPRLAGQQIEYLENQLRAFVERRRPNPIMSNVAHVLSPDMITALATKFRDFNPKPLGGGPKDLVAKGEKSSRRRSRSQCCGLRRLSRPASSGPRGNSSFSRPALSLHHQGVDELGQRAGAKSCTSRHVIHHGAGCTQLDQTANRSRRGLRQQSEVTLLFGMSPLMRSRTWNSEYEIHPAKDSGPGNHFPCRFLCGRSRREPRCSQLHLVSWRIGARLSRLHRAWPDSDPNTSRSNL